MAYETRSNVVDVYVRYLREKIDRPFGCDSLETVRGVGYRLREPGVLKRIPIRWRLAAAFAVVDGGAPPRARGVRVPACRGRAPELGRPGAAGAVGGVDRARGGGLAPRRRRARVGDGRAGRRPGRTVARSDPATLPALLDSSDAAARARAARCLTTISLGDGELNRWRVLAVPDGEQVLVVARPLRQTEETLHHLFRGLIVAGPIGLLLATLGGYLLAAAALRPVESMRRRASAISATTPGARLPVPPSRDEIRDLAETLNEMLARLEAALEHERRFVADASHELRTPLALLKAELELALRRPRTRGRASGSGRARPPRRPTGSSVLAEDLLLIARSDQEALGLRSRARRPR